MTEIEVIFEDSDILVLNKPSGVTVNNSQTTTEQFTVQDYLTAEYSEVGLNMLDNDSNDESGFQERNGIVHRLDRETSGVLIVAKNESSFIHLQAQFKARTVQKEYYAYVIGAVSEDKIEINAPIARNPKNRTKMAIVANGRPSMTLLEKERTFELSNILFTAVRVFPKTGRTHRIRVHLAALNHPVVGDRLYAGVNRYLETLDLFGRLMLHARRITFTHPTTGTTVMFESPLPQEFAY